MIVREPSELAYLREQEQREQQAQIAAAQQIDDPMADDEKATLGRLIDSYGIEPVLEAIATTYKTRNPGMSLHWRYLSDVYLSGAYDSPEVCSCDEF
ncbi:MAG: hypothetical protein F6K19_05120 [Cyanothece sp. SIO1E1]|nr:hypothetical protein [Cyanothece sp. SIO1E1]